MKSFLISSFAVFAASLTVNTEQVNAMLPIQTEHKENSTVFSYVKNNQLEELKALRLQKDKDFQHELENFQNSYNEFVTICKNSSLHEILQLISELQRIFQSFSECKDILFAIFLRRDNDFLEKNGILAQNDNVGISEQNKENLTELMEHENFCLCLFSVWLFEELRSYVHTALESSIFYTLYEYDKTNASERNFDISAGDFDADSKVIFETSNKYLNNLSKYIKKNFQSLLKRLENHDEECLQELKFTNPEALQTALYYFEGFLKDALSQLEELCNNSGNIFSKLLEILQYFNELVIIRKNDNSVFFQSDFFKKLPLLDFKHTGVRGLFQSSYLNDLEKQCQEKLDNFNIIQKAIKNYLANLPETLKSITNIDIYLRRLIKLKRDLEEIDKNDQTPIFYAIKNAIRAKNVTPLLSYLVENCLCNANVIDKKNCTPLLLAVQSGNSNLVHYLIEVAHSNPTFRINTSIPSPMACAIQNGHLEIVCILIERSDYGVDTMDISGMTPLMWACYHKKSDIAQYLIDQGADINSHSADGNDDTPLHIAVKQRYLDIVTLLTKAGADLKAKDNLGNIPLCLACYYRQSNILKFLARMNPFSIEERNNTGENALDMVNDFIKKEEKNTTWVRIKKFLERKLISAACYYGPLDKVKHLVEDTKIDVNVKDKENWTPLRFAIEGEHFDIVKYLVLEQHCNADIEDKYGLTPLFIATERGYFDIVKLLIEERNCEVNVKNENAETPLHWAFFHGYFDIAKYLIEKNADVDAKDNSGNTPEDWAHDCGQDAIVDQLVNEGIYKRKPKE